MFFVHDYVTDTGRAFYRVKLNIELVGENPTGINEEDLVPQIIKNTWQLTDSPCVLSIKPRKFLLYIDDTNYFSLMVPFQAGSPQWLLALTEVSANLSIKRVAKVGEEIDNNTLRILYAS